jgi:K(+)-stimulated pyrophosphate-energized sodium pump
MTELALLCAIGVLGLAFPVGLARWLLGCAAGDGEMARMADLVRVASEGFFRKQTGTILAVSAVFAGAIFLAYGLLRSAGEAEPVPALELGIWLTLSFVLGTVGSVVSGRIVLWTTVRTSLRAAAGVRRSTDRALQICLRGGAVSGVCITTMGILGTGALFAAAFAIKGGFGPNPAEALRLAPSIPFMIAGLALGASFAALLARIGSGVFAKAADLGADLAAMEFGIGEDDRKNPAVIADLAGDVVGGGAARGSALFEATVCETLAAMLVGGMAYRDNPRLPSALALLFFPLVTRGFGLVAAMFGVMVVRSDDREDPRSALSRGLYVTWLLHAVGFAGASKWLLGSSWLLFFACGVTGMAAGGGMLLISQYFTEHRFRPVRDLAEAARAGPTFAILHGVVTSLDSALWSLGVVGTCGLAAFRLGAASGLAHGGLLGIAVATMGMLGPAAYVLAMDAFGPIADNAAGLVETSLGRDRLDVRGRTAFLDAVGNTVKTFTGAWSSGAGGLCSLLLVAAYLDESWRRVGHGSGEAGVPGGGQAAALSLSPSLHSVLLSPPEMFVAMLIGIGVVGWITSRAIIGAARGARRLLDEVGRQLRDGPPELVPDHEACLELISGVAVRHMIAPAVVAAASPLVVGVALRFALAGDNPCYVADSVAAMVMAGTIAGVFGSFLLGNAGGTWDNAKKYIATGAHGGRHIVDESGTRVDNPTYGAAVVGDSVGDPLKDVAAPAMHVLAKMLPIVAIVLLPFFV